ncbi:MAG: HAMP domain-containing histidine kinase [Clostridia bacterium]|nr:HAMP domain-containing histidine kinase [Clostridia bacterium]
MSKNKEKIKKRRREGGSLMLRTWVYFVGMTLIILAVLWVTEFIMFRSYYNDMKEREITNECRSIANNFTGEVTPEYMHFVEQSVMDNTMRVTVFRIEGNADISEATNDNVRVLINVDPLDGHDKPLFPKENFIDEEYTKHLKKGNEVFSYRTRSFMIQQRSDAYILVSGCEKTIGTDRYYFCVVAPVIQFSATTTLLANQLVVATIACVIVAVLFSYAFAKNITRPITEYAQIARRMGKGEKVTFHEVGMAEYDELAKTLNNASSELEKTEKMRRDFLANVSHDLRTPLTMVKAYAEMIRDISGSNEKKRTEHCEVIIDEVDRLTLLVNDILDLSKIQSGTRKPDFKKVDLSVTIGDVVDRFAIYRENDGYNFVTEIAEECLVRCDERMLEQILYNLISNAVNYTGEDKKVTIKLTKTESVARVEVSDTGKGIAPAEKDKIWERYYRASQAKRAVVGSGLGLSIVKNLLIVNKAKYGVDSVVNHGTTFWFELPLVQKSKKEKDDKK